MSDLGVRAKNRWVAIYLFLPTIKAPRDQNLGLVKKALYFFAGKLWYFLRIKISTVGCELAFNLECTGQLNILTHQKLVLYLEVLEAYQNIILLSIGITLNYIHTVQPPLLGKVRGP